MVTDGKWRDKAGIDGPLMRAAFPQAAIEERDQWLDLTRLNSTIVFDRALIINRKAAETQ
jgi:protein O-GlcNAc transferase